MIAHRRHERRRHGCPAVLTALRTVAVAARHDPEKAALQIDVLPTKPKCFALVARTCLAQDQGVESKRRVDALLKQPLVLRRGEDDRLPSVVLRCLSAADGIAISVLPTLGHREDGVQDRAVLRDCAFLDGAGHCLNVTSLGRRYEMPAPPRQETFDVAGANSVHGRIPEFALEVHPYRLDAGAVASFAARGLRGHLLALELGEQF